MGWASVVDVATCSVVVEVARAPRESDVARTPEALFAEPASEDPPRAVPPHPAKTSATAITRADRRRRTAATLCDLFPAKTAAGPESCVHQCEEHGDLDQRPNDAS